MKPTSYKGDIFTADIIQKSADFLAPYIANLVNASFESSLVPHCLKESWITPLLKKANLDPSNPANYRPITNVSFLLKILDLIAFEQIQSFLETFNLLNPKQSGFRRFHGTESALLDLKNNISLIIDKGSPVLLLLLDLSAAFDLVDHNLLTERLRSNFAFSDKAANWIGSFLGDRSVRVFSGPFSAEPDPLPRGVPQGACLSPTLYNLYTRPLFDALDQLGVGFTNYADDTQLYFPLSGVYSSDLALIQKVYSVIQGWMAQNQLALNGDKTEILLLGTRHSLKKLSPEFKSFEIEGCSIQASSAVKTLGLYIDSTLSMWKQVLYAKSSCAYVIKLLRQIRQFLSRDNLARVAGALVNSRLDYCNSLLAGVDEKVINSLQIIQNNAVRVVSGVSKREHISFHRRSLHWLPVKHRISHKVLTITHKCLHGSAPKYLKDCVHRYVPSRALRSSSSNKLCVPNFKLSTVGGRTFSAQASLKWNQLPLSISSLNSLSEFKKATKTLLFDVT